MEKSGYSYQTDTGKLIKETVDTAHQSLKVAE
jgi:hypothetical protein